jgi:hypothetical protein
VDPGGGGMRGAVDPGGGKGGSLTRDERCIDLCCCWASLRVLVGCYSGVTIGVAVDFF